MGCKVQSIWHIWTLLLLPFVKLQHFFTQLCRNTDHNVWNVLILSELFNNLLFYILHILHFLLQNSLCSCLFPPNLRGFCSSPGPRRTGMEVPAPSSSHPAPRGCCRSVRHPWGRGGRATGLRGHGQDTREAAARWAALQTLHSCFLHGIPKKVMWPSPGDESTFWDTGIKLHCASTARRNRVLGLLGLFFHSKEKIQVHALKKLHQTIM